MESCTGQKIDFDRLNPANLQRQSQADHSLASTRNYFQNQSHPDLPDKALVLALFQHFKSSPAHRSFPLIHPDILHHTVEAAYEGNLSDASPDSDSARACIFSFILFVAFLMEERSALRGLDLHKYMHEAQYLLCGVLDSRATLDGIQALLMVVSQEYFLRYYAELVYMRRTSMVCLGNLYESKFWEPKHRYLRVSCTIGWLPSVHRSTWR